MYWYTSDSLPMIFTLNSKNDISKLYNKSIECWNNGTEISGFVKDVFKIEFVTCIKNTSV